MVHPIDDRTARIQNERSPWCKTVQRMAGNPDGQLASQRATAMAVGKKLKKVAVLARNCPGFIGNRMVFPYAREAQFMVEEGATVEAVNDALYNFGMAMGPLAMMDLSGIDVFARIREEFKHEEKPGVRQPLLGIKLYEVGAYGQKTSRGFSLYDENRRAQPNPEVVVLAASLGVPQRTFTAEEIVERCMLSLVNEGAQLLDDESPCAPSISTSYT